MAFSLLLDIHICSRGLFCNFSPAGHSAFCILHSALFLPQRFPQAAENFGGL